MSRTKTPSDLPVGCIHHPGLSRRKFLAGCAACAGLAGISRIAGASHAPRNLVGAEKTRIRVIYALHGP